MRAGWEANEQRPQGRGSSWRHGGQRCQKDISPNLTGKILLWGRGTQEVEGSQTKHSKARLCTCLSHGADGDSCALHDPRGTLWLLKFQGYAPLCGQECPAQSTSPGLLWVLPCKHPASRFPALALVLKLQQLPERPALSLEPESLSRMPHMPSLLLSCTASRLILGLCPQTCLPALQPFCCMTLASHIFSLDPSFR